MEQALLHAMSDLGMSPSHRRMPTRPPEAEETERAAAQLVEQMAKVPGTTAPKTEEQVNPTDEDRRWNRRSNTNALREPYEHLIRHSSIGLTVISDFILRQSYYCDCHV